MKHIYLFSLRRLALAAALSLFLGACAPASQATAQPVTLRMAVLPILDTLPMYVAQKEGLFEKHSLKVEFIPAPSAAERDQLIQAGQADGLINDPLSTMLYNKDKIQVVTVRYARVATQDISLFRLLASAKSGITTAEGLKGVEIGVSQSTVIEYLTYRLLQAEGLKNEEIKTIAVPKIPDRLALLGSGELKAAMLPEPSASLAIQQGAISILDDTKHPEYSFSTINFRKSVIDEHPQAVRAFLAAIEEATALINADPSKYSTLLSDQKLVPQPLMGSFAVPRFVTAGVPSEAQWKDVLAWAKEKGLISSDISYQDSVNASFLP